MARYYDFAGQKIILPGSYTQRKFPEEDGAGAVLGRVIIMGEAIKGGIPYNAYNDIEDVINTVESQSDALEWFGGGDIYYGAEFFLTPSKDDRFNKPSKADCIVVNQMTAASEYLVSGVDDIIEMTFKKYGVDGNTVAVKVSTGSNTGKLIQMNYKGNEILKKDNVTLNMMSIRYTGTAVAATITIDGTTLTTSCTGVVADDLNITLADYTDLGSLINYINTQPNYTCLLTGKSDELTTVFDAVTAIDIKTSAYSVIAGVEAIIRILNATEVLTAELKTGAARSTISNMSDYLYLLGGTVSAATTSDWIAALEKLEGYELNNIVAMSGSITIQDLVKNHVDEMNSITKKKYRQAGFGAGSTALTKAARIAQMKALNSAYIEYCVSSFSRYDYVNKVLREDFDPYYLYPLIAGLRYANSVGMDVVFKYLNILATPDISSEDQEEYAESGGTLIQKTVNVNNINNFEIKVNNTTYQGSQVTRTNPAVVYEINALTKDYEEVITNELRSLDTVANSVIIAKIQNWIVTYLFPRYRDDYKWITDGPDGQKAFDNVSFTQEGEQFITTATLTMSVTPRFAFNFMTYIIPGQKV